MGSHRRLAEPGNDRRTRGTRATVLSAATATAAAALAAAPACAAPPDRPAAGTLAELDRLYGQAERATEAYDRATERARTLAGQVSRAQDRLARGQQRINTLRGALGSLAGEQYRTGGLDPAVRLFLSSRPENYLDRASALDRAGNRATERLRQLRALTRTQAQDRDEAVRGLAELERSRRAVARHKQTVERKLAAARRLLLTLPAAQRAAHAAGTTPNAPYAVLGAVLDPGAAPASARAAAAFAAAQSALGRPYVWGAEGPGSFDCSGLVQWAYGQAGVALPRTSQEQRFAGRQVPLAQARPGDLVAYRADASHIALYAGRGQVIHAPYPGARVRYDPVGMLPISSVTRI
ncbi:C40 family peptidase [Streptomyces odontomachi]|uniref:C40 family peptidase n=1 Tax=Streptomyces odontomachi TaxID=2944940 RepID=UPI00210AE5E0|nr:C40 family peptidase [Streptomyces sp. ODS25]